MKFITLLICIIALVGCQAGTKPVPGSVCLQTDGGPVAIAGGQGVIGAADTYGEEAPERVVEIGSFDIDATEVTNVQFSEFVEATGYVTDAEKTQDGLGGAGGAVFTPPQSGGAQWWKFVEGANWRRPDGPDSTIEGRDNDPVVQVTVNDAKAYAEWADRRLPTEEEWEYAARAGSTTLYVWGDELAPEGKDMANHWQGAFPVQNTLSDGYPLRAPVGCFPPNDNGLYDMIGNVWEWTDTIYAPREGEQIYAIKGGSFLCAKNYCRRYRASARQSQEAGLPTNHIGFRTVSK